MYLTIRFRGGPRSSFGDHDCAGILTHALERFSQRLTQVHLYVADSNGPRGGVDKQCRCVLHLRRRPPVVIQDQDESMYALIHRVANRAAYALSRLADRRSRQSQRARLQKSKSAE